MPRITIATRIIGEGADASAQSTQCLRNGPSSGVGASRAPRGGHGDARSRAPSAGFGGSRHREGRPPPPSGGELAYALPDRRAIRRSRTGGQYECSPVSNRRFRPAPLLDSAVRAALVQAAARGAGPSKRSLFFDNGHSPALPSFSSLARSDLGGRPLNPVAYGSRSNIKMAEYLAAGLPVVSTPIGVRGFERHGGKVIQASLDDFADAVAAAVERPFPPGDAPADPGDLAWPQIGRRLARAYGDLGA